MGRMHNPPHPGAVLQEWLVGVSVTQAARQLGVTRACLSCILHGHAGISADMALRLSALLGTSAELWLGMQTAHDLWQASQQPRPQVQRLALADHVQATEALGVKRVALPL
jgi:addiction module HigA family antidote